MDRRVRGYVVGFEPQTALVPIQLDDAQAVHALAPEVLGAVGEHTPAVLPAQMSAVTHCSTSRG